jgi:hypothetical protein
MVKEEADEAMEDTAPPGTDDLSPEYQAVLTTGYNEDALLQQVLEASKADEDRAFPTSRRPLRSQEWWRSTWPLCHLHHNYRRTRRSAYEGQEEPPPPGVLRRRCRHDHPHGVVINPPPQPEVIVDLVSNDEE